MNKKYGFIRVAASVPEIEVANPEFNAKEIIKEIKILENNGVQIVTFPELSLTGYTCTDLFNQEVLLEKSLIYLEEILKETKDLEIISIIGMPILMNNQLFNCGVVIHHGKILGIVPKTYIPNYNEFYEKRWFSRALDLKQSEISMLGSMIPIGTDLLFKDKEDGKISFAIEICEDLWSPKSPSTDACLNGASIIFNLSASNEIIGKYEYRKELIKIHSAKNICAYIYTSAGINESTTDLVFSGYASICENGSILKENKRFDFNSNHIIADIDVKRIINDRLKNKSFMEIAPNKQYRTIEIDIKDQNINLLRDFNQYPFVPNNEQKRKERCEEIIRIEASGLAKRLKATNLKKCVIGISGGLDSTLAFLVILEAYKMLNISNDHLIAITMPGFGTTGRTYQNALSLMKSYGVTIKEISIKEACMQHFKDIGLEEGNRSVTYENAQARERTKILMDVANYENGLVIGTGDLSELALGWCTYNGDHMSMYAINSSIPKTLVRYLVKYFAEQEKNKESKKTILDILDTPISPELLPPDKLGNMNQKTESIVGPYILHDFYLYHFLRYGASPEKIRYIASITFKDMYSKEEINKWLNVFIKRFFNQQFKRSCLPDGPKVGTISVSPRGDLRMPSDASSDMWLAS